MTHLLSHQLLQIEIPVLGCVPVDAPAWTCLGLQQPSWAGRLSQAESERKRANARPTPPEPAKADAMGQSSPSAPPSDRSLALRAPPPLAPMLTQSVLYYSAFCIHSFEFVRFLLETVFLPSLVTASAHAPRNRVPNFFD